MGDVGLFLSSPLTCPICLPLALGFRQAESVVCHRRAAWTWSAMDPLGFAEVADFMCSRVLTPHGATGPAGGDMSATMCNGTREGAREISRQQWHRGLGRGQNRTGSSGLGTVASI